jgi:hypothetical protein
MKRFVFLLLALASTATIHAQNCDLYIPVEEGTTLSYKIFNDKGKETSAIKQTLISKAETSSGTEFLIKQDVKNDKDVMTNTLKYKCEGNRFLFDMNSFIDKKTLESYKDMKVEMTIDEVDIPVGVTAGTTLKDGSIIMKVVSESPIQVNLKTFITNRKVEAIETITTPAGTFECLKLTQTITTDMGIAKMTIKTVDWISKNVGTVKSESYSKAGKLTSTMILQSISKQ